MNIKTIKDPLERFKTKDTLPNTLHGILKVALDDLETISKRDDYNIYISAWHKDSYGPGSGRCEVCLAGSVMARITDYNPKTSLHPTYFQFSLSMKLFAIEDIRTVNLTAAYCCLYDKDLRDKECEKELEEMGYRFLSGRGSYEIPYFTDVNKSMKAYRKLQTELEALGV